MTLHHLIPARATTLGMTLAASALLLLGGCASNAPMPTAQMAVAEAAVQQANNSSTAAGAPGELQVAIAKLASAREAVAAKDFDRATRLAEQAQVDAQVAELHAQSTRSRKAAQESQDAARVLREEISRKTPR